MNDLQTVVVIGGGITGLSAAYRLQKQKEKHKLPIRIVLLEGSTRLGGKISTVSRDGFTIEKGPDSFLARKTSAANLAKEIGLEQEIVRNATGQSYVLVNEKLHPIPGGSVMGIPTEIGPFIRSSLFSVVGKARAAADLFLPRTKVNGDLSLGHFFRRRLGNEVVENLIEPLLSGIYAGDLDHLSLHSTFPQFFELEQKHRSLIVGMKKGKTAAPQTTQGKRQGQFFTIKTGLQSFVERLESKLSGVEIKKSVKVDDIQKANSGYTLVLNNQETIEAKQVIAAVPHASITHIFQEEKAARAFENMPSTSVATVAMAFSEKDVQIENEGTGFVVSRNSDFTITACTWTNKKWPHTTPEGKVLLRCYVGRPGEETVVDLADDEIVKIVLDDLKKIMNITATPDFSIVTRWKNAMPQYAVGHKERVDQLKQTLKSNWPGIYIAGGSYEGLGLPDCIDQGEAAAEQVIQNIKNKK